MRTSRWIGLFLVIVAGVGLLAADSLRSRTTAAEQAPASAAASKFQPVDDSMHEFMEYQFQPTYLRLKAAMAKPPTDRAGWKPIKADSMILAEGGNLLLIRTPAKGGAEWNKWSIAVRTRGGQLYRAAKKQDYPSAQTHYRAMLTSCNACHKVFAKGKHQLKP
jgi:hypothetical protein